MIIDKSYQFKAIINSAKLTLCHVEFEFSSPSNVRKHTGIRFKGFWENESCSPPKDTSFILEILIY